MEQVVPKACMIKLNKYVFYYLSAIIYIQIIIERLERMNILGGQNPDSVKNK